MKKLFFIAAITSVALASCVKNEVAPTAMQQDEITFSPVVGKLTKAVNGEIGTLYDKNESFIVYGWYCEDDAFNPSNASVYMNGVTASYKSEVNNSDDEGTSGAWKPATIFYWPKNGRLTFSAFSPADAKSDAAAVNCDVTSGLRLGDFSVKYAPADQYDLLYSDRAYNKVSSIGVTNPEYDGVDIQFRHALSSIHVKVKTDMTYPDGTITINKIELQNVWCTATFSENLPSGTETESASTSLWEGHKNPQTIVIGDSDQNVAYDIAKYGTTSILIPQLYDHGTEYVSLYVEYTIKNGDGSTLKQKATFKLNEYAGKISGADTGLISQWTKGYRYTYNLTFGLTEVYFAPSVEAWKDVTVDFPAI